MERRFLFTAVALVAVALSSTGWLLADDDDDDDGEHEHHRTRALRTLPPVNEPVFTKECGSCHVAYHPALLPERSWRKTMATLDDHFGENATLDEPTRARIEEYLAMNAADHSPSRRGAMVNRSVRRDETPLRITQTRAWLHWHDDVSPQVFRRPAVQSAANCTACHQGAPQGDFSEHRVRIPR